MIFFFFCIFLLIAGYFIYGKIVEKIFVIDEKRVTPAIKYADGIDFIPMPTWKIFLIQLLDIAGIGPIFGPILGALYGPVALLWIVIGCIFAGAVHDYFSGMLSLRSNGASIPEVVGDAMGMPARHVMRFFSIILLLLVGVVFVLSPAKLLTGLTGVSSTLFIVIIFCYYFFATIVPIDKIIGRVYPLFGALLIFMTFGVGGALLAGGYDVLPSLDFAVNTHPSGMPVWPLLFITIACGAISGFHSTQSPLMARCMTNENQGRFVFYGSMIAEGVIGLIWCAVGLSFYKTPEALNAVVNAGSPSAVVNEVSKTLLGPWGGILAILGVIVLPITSGDTAFRSSRLIIADIFKLDQARIPNRLLLAIPLFVIGFVISTQDFNILWRYFGWANQTLAMLVLWTAAIVLVKEGKFHWIVSIPAAFMTALSLTFLLYADIGFRLNYTLSVIVGAVLSIAVFLCFIVKYVVRGSK